MLRNSARRYARRFGEFRFFWMVLFWWGGESAGVVCVVRVNAD